MSVLLVLFLSGFLLFLFLFWLDCISWMCLFLSHFPNNFCWRYLCNNYSEALYIFANISWVYFYHLLRLKTEGERDDRRWGGWMAPPIQWTWIWVNSGSWWRTGRTGVLQSMGSWRVRHDWGTELNWTEYLNKSSSGSWTGVVCFFSFFQHFTRISWIQYWHWKLWC